MSKKDITDEELEEEFNKAIKANEGKKDKCATPLPANREVGVQRDNVKVKKE